MNENVRRRAVLPLAQFGERVWWMPLQPSNRRLSPLDSRFEQGRYLGPMDGWNTVLVGTASGVVKARTIKRLLPGERWNGSLLDEALDSESTPNALEDDGGRVGIRAPVLQPHAAVPLPPFDRCDGRRCAELTLSNLDTQTIALDAPTQELVVHKRWTIQNTAVPAWRQISSSTTPKVTNDWSEHAIVLLRLPKNQEDEEPQRKRHNALRAKGRSLLRCPGTGVAVAVAAVRRCRLRHRHCASRPPVRKTEFGKGDRNVRCNRRTTGRVKEAKGAARSASSRGQQ